MEITIFWELLGGEEGGEGFLPVKAASPSPSTSDCDSNDPGGVLGPSTLCRGGRWLENRSGTTEPPRLS